MCRGNDAHIDLPDVRRSDALELAFLKDAQQLGLQFRRQIADLVEKDRALVGQLEPTLAHRHGAGERAAFVAEQLAFDQRRRKRGAVHAHQGSVPSRTPIVYRAGKQLLAGSRLAEQQHRRVGAGNLAHAVERILQDRAVADDLVEAVQRLDLFAQVDGL